MESLLTTEQIADWLQVDVVTVRRLVDRGELAAYRVGAEYRFEKKDVLEYLARVRVENPRRAAGGPPMPGRLHGPLGALLGHPEHAPRDRFDKFTERARTVLTYAQEEAQRLGHNYIGTEHLLLGIVREGKGVAARVLESLGVELGRVRAEVEATIGRGDRVALGEIGLMPRAKKVIELSVDEARKLGHHYVGTEHILLGILREREGVACQILAGLGVDLESTRQQVIKTLGEHAES